MTIIYCIFILLAATFILAKFAHSLKSITWVFGISLLAFTLAGAVGGVAGLVVWLLFIATAVVMNAPTIRQKVLTAPLLSYVRAVLPPMSQTERDAIEAGTVWWEAELFRGNPDWSKLMSTPAVSYTHLTLPTNREV